MKSLFCTLLSLIIFCTSGYSEEVISKSHILAITEEGPISVNDVKKKMDIMLLQHHPEYVHIPEARFQFYNTNWRYTLEQLINTELILKEAEEKKISVTDSEVREVLQERYGPDVIATLDQLQVSVEQAREEIYREMVVQRMTWFKATAKAVQRVSPEDVKKIYEQGIKENPPQQEWKYQVVSIRTEQEETAHAISAKIEKLFSENKDSPLSELIENDEDLQKERITISPEYDSNEKNISQAHLAVVSNMKADSLSGLIERKTPSGESIYRIFHLKEEGKQEPPSFDQVSEQIQKALVQQAAQEETAQYVSKLRKRYGYDSHHFQMNIPEGFEPFALQ